MPDFRINPGPLVVTSDDRAESFLQGLGNANLNPLKDITDSIKDVANFEATVLSNERQREALSNDIFKNSKEQRDIRTEAAKATTAASQESTRASKLNNTPEVRRIKNAELESRTNRANELVRASELENTPDLVERRQKARDLTATASNTSANASFKNAQTAAAAQPSQSALRNAQASEFKSRAEFRDANKATTLRREAIKAESEQLDLQRKLLNGNKSDVALEESKKELGILKSANDLLKRNTDTEEVSESRQTAINSIQSRASDIVSRLSGRLQGSETALREANAKAGVSIESAGKISQARAVSATDAQVQNVAKAVNSYSEETSEHLTNNNLGAAAKSATNNLKILSQKIDDSAPGSQQRALYEDMMKSVINESGGIRAISKNLNSQDFPGGAESPAYQEAVIETVKGALVTGDGSFLNKPTKDKFNVIQALGEDLDLEDKARYIAKPNVLNEGVADYIEKGESSTAYSGSEIIQRVVKSSPDIQELRRVASQAKGPIEEAPAISPNNPNDVGQTNTASSTITYKSGGVTSNNVTRASAEDRVNSSLESISNAARLTYNQKVGGEQAPAPTAPAQPATPVEAAEVAPAAAPVEQPPAIAPEVQDQFTKATEVLGINEPDERLTAEINSVIESTKDGRIDSAYTGSTDGIKIRKLSDAIISKRWEELPEDQKQFFNKKGTKGGGLLGNALASPSTRNAPGFKAYKNLIQEEVQKSVVNMAKDVAVITIEKNSEQLQQLEKDLQNAETPVERLIAEEAVKSFKENSDLPFFTDNQRVDMRMRAIALGKANFENANKILASKKLPTMVDTNENRYKYSTARGTIEEFLPEAKRAFVKVK